MNRLILMLLISPLFCFPQKQWKFHIAFEDAIGAKDTIWLIWDTSATNGVDTSFGEGKVAFNYNKFNVFVGNANGDSTKTSALNYSIESNGGQIHAFNYQYPIVIRWDSSLFNASFLPWSLGYINRARIDNDYFFLNNNDPPLQAFNMLKDNQVNAPAFNWGTRDHFPMSINIYHEQGIGINELNNKYPLINLYPNPATDFIMIEMSQNVKSTIFLFDLTGRLVSEETTRDKITKINISSLPGGVYILRGLVENSILFQRK